MGLFLFACSGRYLDVPMIRSRYRTRTQYHITTSDHSGKTGACGVSVVEPMDHRHDRQSIGAV